MKRLIANNLSIFFSRWDVRIFVRDRGLPGGLSTRTAAFENLKNYDCRERILISTKSAATQIAIGDKRSASLSSELQFMQPYVHALLYTCNMLLHMLLHMRMQTQQPTSRVSSVTRKDRIGSSGQVPNETEYAQKIKISFVEHDTMRARHMEELQNLIIALFRGRS